MRTEVFCVVLLGEHAYKGIDRDQKLLLCSVSALGGHLNSADLASG